AVDEATKARGLVRPEDQLLEDADTFPRTAAFTKTGAAERLHVEMERGSLVDRRQIVDVETRAIFSGVNAVPPFRMKVTDPGHRELIRRLERDLDLGATTAPEMELGRLRVPRTGFEDHARSGRRHRLGLDVAETAEKRRLMPRLAARLLVDVVEKHRIVEVERRPQPVELGDRRGRMRLGIL